MGVVTCKPLQVTSGKTPKKSDEGVTSQTHERAYKKKHSKGGPVQKKGGSKEQSPTWKKRNTKKPLCDKNWRRGFKAKNGGKPQGQGGTKTATAS